MPSFLKQIRPLDAVIAVVAVIVLALAAYLGYSVWAQNTMLRDNSPSAREIASLSAKLRANPNNFDVRMRLAQAFAVAGRDNESIEQYKAILKVNKNFVPALSGVGFELLKQKKWKEGEAYFRKIIDLTENDTASPGSSPLETAYFYLGTALMEQRKYEDAVGYFKAALRLRRDSADASYALGGLLPGTRHHWRATRSTSSTPCSSMPNMAEANYDYGILLMSRNDTATAAEHFRRSADAAPGIDKPQIELDKLGDPGRAPGGGQEAQGDRSRQGTRRGAYRLRTRPGVGGSSGAGRHAVRDHQAARPRPPRRTADSWFSIRVMSLPPRA